jgi:hypothetical protein
MDDLQFKIDGPSLKEGVPLPIAISALTSFQSIVDKTYLVITDKTRITSSEREKFYLRATEFKHGSLLTFFDIALQGVQLGLPLVSTLGPQNIWGLTKDTFSLLKTVCGAVQAGKTPTYEFNNEGDVNLRIGDENHHYHGPVFQIAQMALPNYQDLAHLLGNKKLTEISAGQRNESEHDIYLGKEDRGAFDIPTKIQKETTELKCEVFDFNKFKNVGKLSVSTSGQEVAPGEYNFTIFGNQDNVEYIYTLLKAQVTLFCLVEESISPFGGVAVSKLHITGVGS